MKAALPPYVNPILDPTEGDSVRNYTIRDKVFSTANEHEFSLIFAQRLIMYIDSRKFAFIRG